MINKENDNEGRRYAADRQEHIIAAPSRSIWGNVQSRKKLANGIFFVETASHGGIVVHESIADKYISDKAKAIIGQPEHGWYHFEEDCDWAIFAHENRDIIPEKWQQHIDSTLKQWYPEYLGIKTADKPAQQEQKESGRMTHDEYIQEARERILYDPENSKGWDVDMPSEVFWMLARPSLIPGKDVSLVGHYFTYPFPPPPAPSQLAIFVDEYIQDNKHVLAYFNINNVITANVLKTDSIRNLLNLPKWEKAAIDVPSKAQVMDDALDVLKERTLDSSAREFTPEQKKTLITFHWMFTDPEARNAALDGIIRAAACDKDILNRPKQWLEDSVKEMREIVGHPECHADLLKEEGVSRGRSL